MKSGAKIYLKLLSAGYTRMPADDYYAILVRKIRKLSNGSLRSLLSYLRAAGEPLCTELVAQAMCEATERFRTGAGKIKGKGGKL